MLSIKSILYYLRPAPEIREDNFDLKNLSSFDLSGSEDRLYVGLLVIKSAFILRFLISIPSLDLFKGGR